jgi:hypothetical protein
MQGLFFSGVAVASAFAAGCVARAKGFTFLDNERTHDFNTYFEVPPPATHSPEKYAALVLGLSIITGGAIGRITHLIGEDQSNEAQIGAVILGMLIGSVIGINFILGARACSNSCKRERKIPNLPRAAPAA